MTPSTPDAQIDADIAQLRAQFPRTQELYREVCVLLFFRYGVTPTANKLYQLVKKGSMSAPAEALTAFWATLREKSRVRIQSPDLPEELQTALGELAAAVWDRAQVSANEAFAGQRDEAAQSAAHAHAAQALAEAECERMRQELVGSAAALDAAQSRVTELDQALAISVAAASTLQEQVRLAQQGEHQLQRALETARHDFASELDKLRADGKLAQERLKAAETRALLEIDRERGNAAKAQKELTESVKRFDKRDADHRRAQDGLQAQLGDARQQIGMLQGKLGTLEAAYAALREELAHERHIQRTASTASRRTEPSLAGAPRRAARKMPASKTARAKPRT